MKTLKLIALAAFALLFSECKTTAPTAPGSSDASVVEILRTLDTVQIKFYELAMENLNSSPQQVMELTRFWIKTQSNVEDVISYDSTNLEIVLKSGLHTIFSIHLTDKDGIALSRGGSNAEHGAHLLQSKPSKNIIKNKNVLIFAPFVGTSMDDLYRPGELDKLVNIFKNAGSDFKVTVSDGTLNDVRSFGNYGLVIIETHGLPSNFYTGQNLHGLSTLYDTNETEIKLTVNTQLGIGAYDYVRNGSFIFADDYVLQYVVGWQEFLKKPDRASPKDYRLVINSTYINGLFPMPNTIIFGNFCYSGWTKLGETTFSSYYGKVNITNPIATAFNNKQLISYYSYGYDDGTSGILDNKFAKLIEDSLIRALVNGDSTGHAYLNSNDQKFTVNQLGGGLSPNMLFNHHGADDYCYTQCGQPLLDARDAQIYPTVCIGTQVWMAKNLDFDASGSLCYKDDPANCDQYGKLYDWATVMQGAQSSSSSPSKVQGICPKGWHIPSRDEWIQAINFLGGGSIAADAMESPLLWTSTVVTANTNSSGMSVLPAGQYTVYSPSPVRDPQIYDGLHNYTGFWTTTAINDTTVTVFTLRKSFQTNEATVNEETDGKTGALSCRCLKD